MAISAPYHFVPLSNWIFAPTWGPWVNQDQPFQDGLNGEIQLTLTNKTPLLIGERGEVKEGEPTQVHFLTNPDGTYIIPGSTIKGMLRNVLEIASFSKMKLVDDKAFSFRDLASKAYRNQIGTNTKAGFLNFIDGRWELTPCEFLPIHYKDIDEELNTRFNDKAGELSAQDKYRQINLKDNTFSANTYFKDNPQGKGKNATPTRMARLTSNENAEINDAHLVFTGPMSQGKNIVKKKDYLFYFEQDRDRSATIPVPAEVWQAFVAAHGGQAGNNHQKQQTDLITYLQKNPSKHGIPVFWLPPKGGGQQVRVLGLAKMMKLPYANTVHNTINYQNQAHTLQQLSPDLTECLFGRVEDEGELNLKGRVQCTDLNGVPKTVIIDKTLPPVIGGQPRASFFPAYLTQPNTDSEDHIKPGLDYTTWDDDNARIRGWKRYPNTDNWQAQFDINHDVQANVENLRHKDRTAMQNKLFPAKPGALFTGKIRFHNLKPQELGALLWAVTFGLNKDCFHKVGLGKPMGFGQVQCQIDGINASQNSQILQGKQPVNDEQISQWVAQFETMMNQHYQTYSDEQHWQDSPQLKHLLAMAMPQPHPSSDSSSGNENAASFNPNYIGLKAHAENKSDGARKQGKNALPSFIGLDTTPPPGLQQPVPLPVQSNTLEAMRNDIIRIQNQRVERLIEKEKAEQAERDKEARYQSLTENGKAVADLEAMIESGKDNSQITPKLAGLIQQAISTSWPVADAKYLRSLIDKTDYLKIKNKDKKKQRRAAVGELDKLAAADEEPDPAAQLQYYTPNQQYVLLLLTKIDQEGFTSEHQQKLEQLISQAEQQRWPLSDLTTLKLITDNSWTLAGFRRVKHEQQRIDLLKLMGQQTREKLEVMINMVNGPSATQSEEVILRMSDWSLETMMSELHQDILFQLESSRRAFARSQTKGDATENVWRDLFNTYLPKRYQALKAVVIDSKNQTSDEIDIVIIDRQYTPFVFHYQEKVIVPAESVYAVFEVKQTLNSEHIRYAQEKAASVRNLKRTSLGLIIGGERKPARQPHEILAGLLTTTSDFSPAIADTALKGLAENTDKGLLNLSCSAEHGLIHYDTEKQRFSADSVGSPTAVFLFTLMGLLQDLGTVPAIDFAVYGKWGR